MSRRVTLTVLLATLALPAVVSAVAARAVEPCRVYAEAANRWYSVPLPPVREVVSLVQLDDDPCDLVAAEPHAVWVSRDGGDRWRRTWRTDEDPPATQRPITRLFAEGMGAGTVFLALAADVPLDDRGGTSQGLLVSGDSGVTFQEVPAAGMAEVDLVAGTGLAGDARGGDSGSTQPLRRDVYFAGHTTVAQTAPLGRPVVGASIFTGAVYRGKGEFGASVAADERSRLLRPDRLAVDPVAAELWANDVRDTADAARLWRYTDVPLPWQQDAVQSWTPVSLPQPGRVRDVTFATRPADGGDATLLLAAGDFGLVQSADRGATWEVLHDRSPVAAVRAEPRGWGASTPETLMALVDGKPHRAVAPAPLQPVATGLPERCQAEGLTRDAPPDGPASWLVSCADERHWFRYRYAETRGAMPPGGTLPTLPGFPYPAFPTWSPPSLPMPTPSRGPANFPVVPMTDLKTIALPSRDGMAGNLAFDGRTLYYTSGAFGVPGSKEHVVVHRVTAATGAVQPDLVLPIGEHAGIPMLAADMGRRLLYLFMGGPVYAFDLVTHRVALLTTIKTVPVADRFSYDPSLDEFVIGVEMGKVIRHYGRHGRPTDDGCNFEHTFAQASPLTTMIAALVATGDGGGVYVQTEDDSTIFRLDRWCHAVTAYGHRTFSEPRAEDDQMACDGVTFGLPAIWIRDAELRRATAYSVPTGFCAFPVAVPPVFPRPGVPPAPLPIPQPVPQPHPQPQPGPVQQPVPQVQVQPQVQPQAQAQAQAQAQQQVQQQVQQQAQQQIQAGMVPQRQEQPQLAGVQVGSGTGQQEYAMSRRHRRRVPSPALAGVAALLTAAYGVLLGRQYQPARQRWHEPRGGAR